MGSPEISSPEAGADDEAARRAFGEYLRPTLLDRLTAIGLDVVYHRAEGDRLYTREASGDELAVLDLVGGFGAGLLGHNHPELVACAERALRERRPFLAQASVRGPAARLAAALSRRVGLTTGRAYRVTLANSGAEATEAALKHAELERVRRDEARVARQEETLRRLRLGLRDGTVRLAEETRARAARILGDGDPLAVDELGARALRSLREACDRPPLFVALERGFHGKTTGALATTHNREYRAPWTRLGPEVAFVPAGDGEALAEVVERARTACWELVLERGEATLVAGHVSRLAGVLVEPVQGEGGVHAIDPAFLRALRAAADAAGCPLVFDEIQCGMGRTGTFLASEPSGVAADYYLLSKSLGGGLAKVAALLVERSRSAEDFGTLHTSTFADDDLGCELALKVLELLGRDGDALLGRCRRQGAYLLERLAALQARFPAELRAVRGRGLLVGLQLGRPGGGSRLLDVLAEQDLLGFFATGYLLRAHRVRVAPTLSAHGTIRIEPSAYVTSEQLDELAAALEALLEALHHGRVDELVLAVLGEARPAARPAADAGAAGAAQAAPPQAAPSQAAPPQAAPRRGARIPGVRRAGFLAHFLEPDDLGRWDPRLAGLSAEQCGRFLERTRGLLDPFLVDELVVRSATGEQVQASVIGLAFTPAQVMQDLRAGAAGWALALVRAGVRMARDLGCSVVGLGGYTSIVTASGADLVEDDLTITTGNALTAAAALEAAFEAARELALAPRRLGVAGAVGNIGASLAAIAAERVEDVVLVGRPGTRRRLDEAADGLRRQARLRLEAGAAPTGLGRALAEGRDPVLVSDDLGALAGCDLVLTATNAPAPILLPAHVAEGPVVICDVAVPGDVHPDVARARPAARVVRGGLVGLPAGQRVQVAGMRLLPGEIYGCLAETLLVALDDRRGHLTGPITADNVRLVTRLARRHGFRLGGPGVARAPEPEVNP